ncbi:MAG: sigma-70 family RNA polymerase sigma factor [Lachnospiraceae bacterium]|nr:sigma-70 family RNA polymerase sigma factor [Lachnospiraceae bacterium]
MKEPNHQYLAELVLETRKGNNNAFAELYALTYEKVYNYARHYLRDDYLAQDAVQEIYINALRNIQNLKDPMLFVAWLNKISFSVCFDICKKTDAKYGVVTDSETMETICDDHIDSNPETRTEQNDETRRLHRAIESLPLNEQQVIVMRYFNNMKIEDIADATGFSTSSVKRYLKSGEAAIKQMLGKRR